MRPAPPWMRRLVRRCGDDSGQVTPFVVVLTVALIAVAGLVLDGGMALSTKSQALDLAEAAARAGAQQLDLAVYRTAGSARLDPDRAVTAARGWLSRAHAQGSVSATTASVTVTVTANADTQLLSLVGLGDLPVSATATARPQQGVRQPEP